MLYTKVGAEDFFIKSYVHLVRGMRRENKEPRAPEFLS